MAWPLLLLAILFLLHILSVASHMQTLRSNNNKIRRPWILSSIFIPLLLLPLSIFALSDLESPLSASSSSSSSSSSSKTELISEVENLKLKIAKLESILEENSNTFNSKFLQLEESNNVIEEMEHKIQFLQSSLSKLKTSTGSSSDSETTVKTLEEQVRLLWAELRKNNFNHHILESKVHEDEGKLEEVTSEVLKMENIVTEQWIQIRQLEQSLQMMKMMTSNVRRKCTTKVHKEKATEFMVLKLLKFACKTEDEDKPDILLDIVISGKDSTTAELAVRGANTFIKGIGHHHFPDGVEVPDSLFLGNYISKPCMSRMFSRLRRIWSAIKRWHYELQDVVKQTLEMNEFSAPLANSEVVFLMASAVVVIPIMSACLLLS